MSTMSMVAIIVIAVMIGEGFRNWTKHKERMAAQGKGEDGALARDLEALRARIEVLERIVTDRGYELGREIDALEKGGRRSA